MQKLNSDFFNQSLNPPFDNISNAEEYISTVRKYEFWTQVGLLTDDKSKNVVMLLIRDGNLLCSFRLNVSASEYFDFVNDVSTGTLTYRVWQGKSLERQHLDSLEELQKIWDCTSDQSYDLSSDALSQLISRFESERVEVGRGKSFSEKTKRIVIHDSHGYCMFTGCGDKLDIDTLTGEDGNYSYLAHNVASSEQGERGIPLLSSWLSDEPGNILLLCDKHHRLIDRVAACDYTAERLSMIRKAHIHLVNGLLRGLSFEPIPVYSVLWPVNTNVVSPPVLKEVAACLSCLNFRIDGQINSLADSNDPLRTLPEIFNQNMPVMIKNEADKIIQQTRSLGHRAALFAFGPMPALIGLGAMLGNKSRYIPMLRYRDGQCWMWPKESPVGIFYYIDGENDLPKGEDVIICINFTAKTEVIERKSAELSESLGAHVININAKPEYIGNGAVPHPQDGMSFSAKLQSIFHRLKSDYDVKRIHLLACASNAASVFIGQAYDLHHPDLIVYDFSSSEMVPRLIIKNDSLTTKLGLPDKP